MSNLRKRVRKAGGLILVAEIRRHGQPWRVILGETNRLPHRELNEWWRRHRQMIDDARRCSHKWTFASLRCAGCGMSMQEIAALVGRWPPLAFGTPLRFISTTYNQLHRADAVFIDDEPSIKALP